MVLSCNLYWWHNPCLVPAQFLLFDCKHVASVGHSSSEPDISQTRADHGAHSDFAQPAIVVQQHTNSIR